MSAAKSAFNTDGVMTFSIWIKLISWPGKVGK